MKLEINNRRKIEKLTFMKKLSTVQNNHEVKEEIKETSENIICQRKIKTNAAKFMECSKNSTKKSLQVKMPTFEKEDLKKNTQNFIH